MATWIKQGVHGELVPKMAEGYPSSFNRKKYAKQFDVVSHRTHWHIEYDPG